MTANGVDASNWKASNEKGTTAPGTLEEHETLKTCPYDKSHRILEQRFSLHLRKCREAYIKQREKAGLPIDMEVCVYNYNHHVRTTEIDRHIRETCPTAKEDGFFHEQQ